MLIVQVYLAVNYTSSSEYLPTVCKCIMTADFDSIIFLSISLIIPMLLFMVAPLIFIITAYTYIMVYMCGSNLRTRRSQFVTHTIAIRAFLIAITNIFSWFPFMVLTYALKEEVTQVEKRMAIVFLYVNCITDPLIYSFSNYFINCCFGAQQQPSTTGNNIKENLDRGLSRKGEVPGSVQTSL